MLFEELLVVCVYIHMYTIYLLELQRHTVYVFIILLLFLSVSESPSLVATQTHFKDTRKQNLL